MTTSPSTITTGVDKLMSIIEQKGRVSIPEAAKQLSLPRIVIEEWVDFLEEKGIISIEYKFTTPYLVKKSISPKDIQKKKKTFQSSKEGFVRKVDSAINIIEQEATGLNKIKEDFLTFGSEVEENVQHVKQELAMLEKFDKMKKGMDKELLAQHESFKAEMAAIDKALLRKQSQYKELVDKVSKEELRLDSELTKMGLIQQNEGILTNKVTALKRHADQLEKQLKTENTDLAHTRQLVRHLRRLAGRIERRLKEREKNIVPLIEKRRKQEKSILDTQQKLIEKAVKVQSSISAGTNVTQLKERFNKFFENKVGLEKSVDNINAELEKLKLDLKALVQEAQVVELASGKKSINAEMAGLEKKFLKIEERRDKYENEIYKLAHLSKPSKK